MRFCGSPAECPHHYRNSPKTVSRKPGPIREFTNKLNEGRQRPASGAAGGSPVPGRGAAGAGVDGRRFAQDLDADPALESARMGAALDEERRHTQPGRTANIDDRV